MFVPDVAKIMAASENPMQGVLAWFQADGRALDRRYPAAFAPEAVAARRTFLEEWQAAAAALDVAALSPAAQVDVRLLLRRIALERLRLDRTERDWARVEPFMSYALPLLRLERARLDGHPVAADDAARILAQAGGLLKGVEEDDPPPAIAAHILRNHRPLRAALDTWEGEHRGYDPAFDWWVGHPWDLLRKALDSREARLKEITGELRDPAPILAEPLGRVDLVRLLELEVLACTPEALYALAERELQWCEREMKDVAAQMGHPGDVAAAVEQLKTLHVEPGGQPRLARELVQEALSYLDEHGLVSIPPAARHIWRQMMIKPELQEAYPFLWGGECLGASFAHAGMPDDRKRSAMRSNNIPFLRATVHHEVFPGHHLQLYCGERMNAHRSAYGTAFYGEGWPLYWELLLYERGFVERQEDRLGFLFWRLHRCARVMVVLGFHLGRLSVEECLALIIDRVGHEGVGGRAQVRWLVTSSPDVLYGAAYMLGALQLMALRRELVTEGGMDECAFHDAVLAVNSMPIEWVRDLLKGQPPAAAPSWKFQETLGR